MQITKVKINAFKVLRDVDVNFPRTYQPNMFVIDTGASKNYGKTTFLNLVYRLLRGESIPISDLSPMWKHCAIEGYLHLATISVLVDGQICRVTYSLTSYQCLIAGAVILMSYRGLCPDLLIHACVTDADKNLLHDPLGVLQHIAKKVFLITEPEQKITDRARERNLTDQKGCYYYHELRKVIGIFFSKCWEEGKPDVASKFLGDVLNGHKPAIYSVTISCDTYGVVTDVLINQSPRILPFSLEDLSFEEIRKLTLAVTLKVIDVTDGVILIDTPETGLHLDEQYNLVRNIQDWGSGNQYILASHSYELCTALTPTHVVALNK